MKVARHKNGSIKLGEIDPEIIREIYQSTAAVYSSPDWDELEECEQSGISFFARALVATLKSEEAVL